MLNLTRHGPTIIWNGIQQNLAIFPSYLPCLPKYGCQVSQFIFSKIISLIDLVDNWFLDLLLYNSADDSFDPKAAVNVVINSNGEINYLPPGMFRSTCLIEIYEFPFDEQQCGLKFGRYESLSFKTNYLFLYLNFSNNSVGRMTIQRWISRTKATVLRWIRTWPTASGAWKVILLNHLDIL